MSDEDDDRPRVVAINPAQARILGSDAPKYARLWGLPDPRLDPLARKLFELEVRDMHFAHGEAEYLKPRGERIDLEAFALRWRPQTLAEIVREIAELAAKQEQWERDHPEHFGPRLH